MNNYHVEKNSRDILKIKRN